MLRAFRVWAWLSLSKAMDIGAKVANVRSAKACGCPDCRLVYDEEYRTQKLREALARAVRLRTEAARASQRAPGRRL